MGLRLALFVDGDNLSAVHAGWLLAQADARGGADVARVYADVRHLPGWCGTPGYRLVHAGTGKNAADLLLAIDAVELALTTAVDTFVIASSDGDFSHLALWLRERGRTVVGLGEAKAPQGFRRACSVFGEVPETRVCGVAPVPAAPSATLDDKVRAEIDAAGGRMPIIELNQKMHHGHCVRISEQPEKRWPVYLGNRPHLYDLDRGGPTAMVSLRGRAGEPPRVPSRPPAPQSRRLS